MRKHKYRRVATKKMAKNSRFKHVLAYGLPCDDAEISQNMLKIA